MNRRIRTEPPPPAGLRPFHLPRIERVTLSNGLTLLWAVQPGAPIVTAHLVLDAGASREDREQAGVAHLSAHTVDTGTSKRDAQQLSWEIELLGAHFDAGTGWDSTALSLTAAADRMPAALEILAGMVTDAQFPEAEVQRVRNEQVGEIMQNRSDPRTLAAEMAVRFIYKPTATYARTVLGEPDKVRRLTRAEVQAFTRARYAPGGAALILVGALDDRIKVAAERCLGGWQNALSDPPAVSAEPRRTTTAVYVVDRPGSVQSEVRIGHAGVSRTDADYFPLLVMNAILGGAFTSRLNLNLREKHGFTYGVQSSFSFRRERGPFVIATAVETDVTAPAVREILHDVKLLRTEAVTAEELDTTRNFVAGTLPLELQTTHQLAAKLGELFVYGLPQDYYHAYRDCVSSVSAEDVLRVAQKHVSPEQFAVVVVGDANQIEAPLRALELGPVEVHNVNE